MRTRSPRIAFEHLAAAGVTFRNKAAPNAASLVATLALLSGTFSDPAVGDQLGEHIGELLRHGHLQEDLLLLLWCCPSMNGRQLGSHDNAQDKCADGNHLQRRSGGRSHCNSVVVSLASKERLGVCDCVER